MNSSTFSFNKEWKVLAFVLLVLVGVELAVRDKASRTWNQQHLSEVPRIVETLNAGPEPRILFLGNSLTKAGVDVNSFQDELRDHGVPSVTTARIHPDDTVIQHWYYTFARYFRDVEDGQAPDCVVVTFCLDHLSDQVEPRHRGLAHLAATRQLDEIIRYDLDSTEQVAGFLAAHFFTALCGSQGWKDGVLKRVVPNYESEKQRLNRARRTALAERNASIPGGEPPAYTYTRLRRLISLFQEKGVHGVFVMIPLLSEQTLDPHLAEVIESEGMTFCDLRSLESLTREHYPDGYHMDQVGADIYSRAVARALVEKVPHIFLAGEELTQPVPEQFEPTGGLPENIQTHAEN